VEDGRKAETNPKFSHGSFNASSIEAGHNTQLVVDNLKGWLIKIKP
jgi:hypothetical protein